VADRGDDLVPFLSVDRFVDPRVRVQDSRAREALLLGQVERDSTAAPTALPFSLDLTEQQRLARSRVLNPYAGIDFIRILLVQIIPSIRHILDSSSSS
jgi:hypothetical protein